MKLKQLKQLKKAKGFGSLEIIQRLPKKSRLKCDTTKRQLKAIRGVMDMDRVEMREEVVVLLLTDDQELIAGVSLYRGTMDTVPIDCRDIIQLAAIARAYHVVIAHNHPDGHVQPSDADFDSASRLGHVLRFAGFELLDFYVVSRKKHFSFADKGLMRA